jgi:hypothetical protein
MNPKAVAKISFTVMLFDGLGLFLAVALSLYLRQTPFDLLIWGLTLLPMILLGTGIAVWQAVKELSKGVK